MVSIFFSENLNLNGHYTFKTPISPSLARVGLMVWIKNPYVIGLDTGKKLVGGCFPTPSEKYERQNGWKSSPTNRGEHKENWVATTQKIPGFLGGNPNDSLGSDSSLP